MKKDLLDSTLAVFAEKVKGIKHSGGVLFFCPEDNTALFVLRSKHMSSPKTYSFPGGQPKDSDKSPKETAIREAEEELGFLPDLHFIGRYNIAHNEHRYDVFICEVFPEEKDELNNKIRLDRENESFKWFKINDLPKKQHINLDWVEKELKNIKKESSNTQVIKRHTIMNIYKLAEDYLSLVKVAAGLSRRDIDKAISKAKKDYLSQKDIHDAADSQIKQLQSDIACAKDKMMKAREDLNKNHDMLRNVDFSGADEVRTKGNETVYIKGKKPYSVQKADDGSIVLVPYKTKTEINIDPKSDKKVEKTEIEVKEEDDDEVNDADDFDLFA
jgi:8-oxo-dGTP pyrophosphatase MutT (NUDIX family)